MNYLMVSHSADLLREYQLPDGITLTYRRQGASLLDSFTCTLESFGKVIRIHSTLWLLHTKVSAEQVFESLQALFSNLGESCSDMIVLETDCFFGRFSKETIDQVQKVADVETDFPQASGSTQNKTITGRKLQSSGVRATRVAPEQDRRSYFDRLAEEYEVQPTDALLRRVPGSYENGRRR